MGTKLNGSITVLTLASSLADARAAAGSSQAALAASSTASLLICHHYQHLYRQSTEFNLNSGGIRTVLRRLGFPEPVDGDVQLPVMEPTCRVTQLATWIQCEPKQLQQANFFNNRELFLRFVNCFRRLSAHSMAVTRLNKTKIGKVQRKQEPLKRNYKQWTDVDLKRSVCAGRNGELSKKAAKRVYGVAVRTLTRYLDGAEVGIMPGRKSALSDGEAEGIVDGLIDIARRGFPATRLRLKGIILDMISDGREHQFCAAGPSAKWITGFLKRHKDRISVRKGRILDTSRVNAVKKSDLEYFFAEYSPFLKDHAIPPSQTLIAMRLELILKEELRRELLLLAELKRSHTSSSEKMCAKRYTFTQLSTTKTESVKKRSPNKTLIKLTTKRLLTEEDCMAAEERKASASFEAAEIKRMMRAEKQTVRAWKKIQDELEKKQQAATRKRVRAAERTERCRQIEVEKADKKRKKHELKQQREREAQALRNQKNKTGRRPTKQTQKSPVAETLPDVIPSWSLPTLLSTLSFTEQVKQASRSTPESSDFSF
ncbi:hypothetical protein ON010_g9819 [Phytophthora cinnamomi]|nr:hypothetical protein ON010_g9819 [Phytophthora cinnamomi]